MTPDNWKSVNLSYDSENNTVFIDAPKSAFVPKYLDYALEYLKLPKNAERVFIEELIPWEDPAVIEDLIKELLDCATYGFKQEICGKAAECITYLANKSSKQE